MAGHRVPREETEAQGQCGKERGGPPLEAEVSGLQRHVAYEAEAQNRAFESAALRGENRHTCGMRVAKA